MNTQKIESALDKLRTDVSILSRNDNELISRNDVLALLDEEIAVFDEIIRLLK